MSKRILIITIAVIAIIGYFTQRQVQENHPDSEIQAFADRVVKANPEIYQTLGWVMVYQSTDHSPSITYRFKVIDNEAVYDSSFQSSTFQIPVLSNDRN